MLKKNKPIHIVSITVILIFALNFFQLTPLQDIFFKMQGVFLCLLILFLFFYITSFSIIKIRIDGPVLYWLMIAAILPFYSAFRSHTEFGQPYIYGILVQRSWLLIGVGVWFYFVITTKQIYLSTVEVVFTFMAWASLLFFSMISMGYDPSNVADGLKLGHVTEYRGVRFKFQNFFITFGAIYYFIYYHFKRKPGYFLSMLLFIAYIFFLRQGRTYMLALAGTFLIFYLLNFSVKKQIITFINISYFLIISIFFISLVNPDYLIKMGFMFEQMFTVLTGKFSQDASANARISQSLAVFDYFNASPMTVWFGVGKLSNQWNEGFFGFFDRFYPSDIGILGGLFLYGFFGLFFVYFIPLLCSIQVFKKIDTNDIFILSIKYLLLFMIIRSVQGSYIHKPILYILPLFILYAYLKLQLSRQNDSNGTLERVEI